jgi:hypothetical protein
MHNFFGHAHATAADCFWSGVYFHGEAERLVNYRAGTEQAPDLVACRDPLQAYNLGQCAPGGIRPVLSRFQCRAETGDIGEPCVVYGQAARLFLWFGSVYACGLIVLETDTEALEYAQTKRRTRNESL